MRDLIDRARRFATEAHERIDQRRKYTQQPYQVHLKAVAAMVAVVTDDPEMIAAAWLHDTVEDTPATFGDLEREFGSGVAALVADLTDLSKPSDGNRAVRKAIDHGHTAQASPRAKTIKLADLTDNCRDICRHDPSFARVYLAEAAALLDRGGHRRLGMTSDMETTQSRDPSPESQWQQSNGQRPFAASVQD
jgi:(p)ppGpp synthase/HD superfamily hydrolase